MLTERRSTWQDATVLVGKISRALRRWASYFSVGSTRRGYRVEARSPIVSVTGIRDGEMIRERL
ncbi:hypothetical protein NOVOSPHI9U_260168 [Novosphingobium sp. 9U]|nr:hypothetical protein NOVOSPHI9U_260168 [Novosphingobium sp. 9U]